MMWQNYQQQTCPACGQSRMVWVGPPSAETPLEIRLELSVHDLPFPARVKNALRFDDITTVRQLVTLTQWKVLAIPQIGKKSLEEIKEVLSNYGLSLGMRFP